jgi:hypothetical protein
VVMFNTCSIRDHAEQKLYDALGPFAARKRKGETLALIVTGCVAQQEGEELLRRVPEVDVVLGPQYVPFLENVLESVEWGHQVGTRLLLAIVVFVDTGRYLYRCFRSSFFPSSKLFSPFFHLLRVTGCRHSSDAASRRQRLFQTRTRALCPSLGQCDSWM